MTFRLDSSQSVTIGSETGAPLVTGGTYTGAASDVVNAAGVPVEEGVTYALVSPISSGAEGDTVSWTIEMTAGTDVWSEADGFGEDGAQLPVDEVTGAGVSVRYWTPRLTGTARFTLVRTGNPTITAPYVAPLEGALISAGTPRGARVEVDADGLHAYDSAGTETATIRGQGGEFVGGSYRTTGGSAGRVTMSDTAANGNPGIEVEPMVTTGYSRFPSISPGTDGMQVAGGVGTDGTQSGVVAKHSYSSIWHNGATITGSGSWAEVTPTEVKMTYRADRSQPAAQSKLVATAGQAQMIAQLSTTAYSAITTTQNGSELYTTDGAGTVARSTADTTVSRLFFQTPTVSGQVRVDSTETYVMRQAGGVSRYLTVDDTGIWVKTNAGGTWKFYNLESTASDSGWVNLTPATGYTVATEGCAVRQLGRMIHFLGGMRGNIGTDWTTITTIPAGFRPTVRQVNAGASSTITNLMFQTLTTGELQVKGNNTGTNVGAYINTIFYPID